LIKSLYKILFSASLFIPGISSTFAQAYELDFSDSTTYSTTCGKVVPSAWTVKQDSCLLYTPSLAPGFAESDWLAYSIKINQSGNLGPTDNAYIQHQINDGTWVTDTLLIGDGLAAVFSLHDSIWFDPGDVFRIRIIMETSSGSDFWQIKNGDIQVFYDTTQTVLPVEFLSFNIIQDENFITINWQTASETNNDYFVVEKSEDVIIFEEITIIEGAGNSNQISYYTAEDIIFEDQIIYYRIKQIDYDGKYSYSDIIATQGTHSSQSYQDIVMNNNGFSLIINAEKKEYAEINIVNVQSGQLIKSIKQTVQKGSNYIPINELIDQSGLYCISSNVNQNFFSKVIPFFPKE